MDTNGVISTVAGNGIAGYSGDGGPATSAGLNQPIGVVVDSSGNLFIGDFANNRIRQVNANGVISTVAGNGTAGYSGDGGPATSAELQAPAGVGLDSAGDIFIADTSNFVIRIVNPAGTISTVAGNRSSVYFPGYTTSDPLFGSYGGDNYPADGAELSTPSGVAVDRAGNVFIADGNGRIRKVSVSGVITTVAGGGSGGDGGPATSASLAGPTGVAVDDSGNIFITEYAIPRVRNVNSGGIISTIAGSGEFAGPTNLVVDSSGNVFVADRQSNRVMKIDTSDVVTVVAGNGTCGYRGDGGPATSAELCGPYAVAADSAGNLFIADWENNAVRKVDTSGTISTFASIFTPLEVATDSSGDVFVADGADQLIYKVDTSGNTTTVAGTPNSCLGCNSFGGDGGPAVGAQLSLPGGIAVNTSGDILYIADLGNNRIREVYPSSSGFLLSLAENGSGAGTVISLPDGISCGSTCSANLPSGLVLTLNAYPATGSSFYGWSGACSGLGACSVPMSADQSVTATFNLGPPPDFSVAAASQSLNLHPGSQTTDVITVAPQNGSFGGLVQLSCAMTGSTPVATCSLSPTSVTPGAASATSTLTVNAPAQSARLMTSVFYAAFMPVSLALIGISLGSSKSTQRKRPTWLLYSFLVAFVVVQAACGGSHPVQPKNYTVTITAASGAIQHTTQVTVTVQ